MDWLESLEATHGTRYGRWDTDQVVDQRDEDGAEHAGDAAQADADAAHHRRVQLGGQQRQHDERRRDAELAHAVQHQRRHVVWRPKKEKNQKKTIVDFESSEQKMLRCVQYGKPPTLAASCM